MTKRMGPIAAGLVVSLVCANPVGAQSGPASQLNNPTPRSEASRQGSFQEHFDTRMLMGDPTANAALHGRTELVAQCLARLGGGGASRFIGGALSGDPEYKTIGKALERRYELCAGKDKYLPPVLVSGALAEELMLTEDAAFEDRAPSVNVDDAEKFFGGLDGAVTLDALTGCLAVYSPGLAYKVLKSATGSTEESAALQALYRATPECGVAAPPEIPEIYQRGAIATALYLWTSRKS